MTAGPVSLRALVNGAPTDVPALGVVGAALPIIPFAVASGGEAKTLAAHLRERADLSAENTFMEKNAFAKVLAAQIGLKTATVSDLNPGGSIRDYVHSGFWQFENATSGLGYPGTGWHNLISASHSRTDIYFAMQFASPFFQNEDFFVRNTNNDGSAPWRKLWHSRNLTKGRTIGDVVVLENFIGAPAIISDGLQIRPVNANGRSYANLAVMKTIDPGADPGVEKSVSCNLLVQTDIKESMAAFNWNGFFKVHIHAGVFRRFEGGDEPVTLGASMQREADIPAWCFYTSTYDTTSNPIFPMLGWESGLSVNGPDPNNVRVMIDMQFNSIDDRDGFQKYGNNQIGCGINMSPSLGEPERVIVKKGIQMKGRFGVCLYFADTTAYSREIAAFPYDGFISWRAPTTKDENGRDVNGTLEARFGWNRTLGTFFRNGVKTLPTADPNITVVEEVINGTTVQYDVRIVR